MNGTTFLTSQRYVAVGNPSTCRSNTVSSNKMAPMIFSPSNASQVMIRDRMSCITPNMRALSFSRTSVIPYSASARGVEPPLWSSAATKPGAEAMRARCKALRSAAEATARSSSVTGTLLGSGRTA